MTTNAENETKTTTATKTIRIENVGPIERLAIPLPEAGVVVLRGRNGTGKSHALAAVDSLVGGRGRPPCRDHAKRGLVEGMGARLTIGRSTRRSGEAEVITLEGRLDISQLVQPPIKDEESADRTRIKALIQLSGASADPSAFEAILPDWTELGELVSPTDLASDDPVMLAGKVKRALEAEARRHEKVRDDAAAKAAALQEQVGTWSKEDLDLRRDQTEAELQAALVAQKELQTQAAEADRRRAQAQKARQTLDTLRSQVPADQSIESLEAEEADLEEKVRKLEQALAVARERRQQVRRQLSQARTTASQVEQLEKLLAEVPEPVPAERIDQAAKRVDQARDRHDLAIRVERARGLAGQADQHRQEATRHEEAAQTLRDAAHSTDEVLSDLVGRVTRRLRVETGRLVTDTDRGAEPFGELSPGERWRIALEIATEQVGPGGLVTVPQEAWESLDPVNHDQIGRIAREIGVVILTAEADEQAEVVVGSG